MKNNLKILRKKLYQNDKIYLSNFEWYDEFKNKYMNNVDLKDDKLWSTFDKCTVVNFFIKNNKYHFIVKIFNGDSFNGKIKDLRWTAEFTSNDDNILIELEKHINKNFIDQLNIQLDIEDQIIRDNRLNNLEKKILSSNIDLTNENYNDLYDKCVNHTNLSTISKGIIIDY